MAEEASFAEKIDEIRRKAGRLVVGPAEVIAFPKDPTYSVPPETRSEERRGVDALFVTEVIIHWPPGTNQLLDVNVRFDGIPLVPEIDGWVNKDSATVTYTVNRRIDGRVTLTVTWRNRDTQYYHRVPVEIEYIRRKASA